MELNKCPKCNSENLDYCDRTTNNNAVTYEVICLDCDFEGLEHHLLVFEKYTDTKGNDLE